jgi:MFS family permease
MLQNSWLSRVVTPRKAFLGVFILLLNAFTWYYMAVLIIDSYLQIFSLSTTAILTLWLTYYGSVIASSIIGSIIPGASKIRFLHLWMLIGTVSSFLPALSFIPPQVWSFALGFTFGIGMPACLTYFANHSAIENRGKTGGIIFLSFSLSAALLAVAFTQLNLTMSVLFLALWRSLGLLAFIPLKMNPENNVAEKKHVSFREVTRDRSLRLYIAAWTIFNLVDSFEWSIWGRNLAPSLSTVAVIGPILGSVAAFIGGALSDRVGRKKVVICGFVILGLAYGVLGIAPDELFSRYLYLAVDGIAWGVLFVTFLFTLWGDLSQHGGAEKYYVIGAAPYFLKGIVDSIVTYAGISGADTAAFSLASLFLFIAVLPLLFAPETMPEKNIEIRRLKGYLDQAKKLGEKHS